MNEMILRLEKVIGLIKADFPELTEKGVKSCQNDYIDYLETVRDGIIELRESMVIHLDTMINNLVIRDLKPNTEPME
jgi:hypothetical protein